MTKLIMAFLVASTSIPALAGTLKTEICNDDSLLIKEINSGSQESLVITDESTLKQFRELIIEAFVFQNESVVQSEKVDGPSEEETIDKIKQVALETVLMKAMEKFKTESYINKKLLKSIADEVLKSIVDGNYLQMLSQKGNEILLKNKLSVLFKNEKTKIRKGGKYAEIYSAKEEAKSMDPYGAIISKGATENCIGFVSGKAVFRTGLHK